MSCPHHQRTPITTIILNRPLLQQETEQFWMCVELVECFNQYSPLRNLFGFYCQRNLVHITIIILNLHLMLQNSKAPLPFSSRTCLRRSYITVIDICILRQLSKTTSLAQGRRISLKCKWVSKKVGSDLRGSVIHTVVLSQ